MLFCAIAILQFLQDAPNLARSVEMAEALLVLHGDSCLGVSERDMESEDRLSIHTHSDTLGKCFNQYVEKNSA